MDGAGAGGGGCWRFTFVKKRGGKLEHSASSLPCTLAELGTLCLAATKRSVRFRSADSFKQLSECWGPPVYPWVSCAILPGNGAQSWQVLRASPGSRLSSQSLQNSPKGKSS